MEHALSHTCTGLPRFGDGILAQLCHKMRRQYWLGCSMAGLEQGNIHTVMTSVIKDAPFIAQAITNQLQVTGPTCTGMSKRPMHQGHDVAIAPARSFDGSLKVSSACCSIYNDPTPKFTTTMIRALALTSQVCFAIHNQSTAQPLTKMLAGSARIAKREVHC